MTQFWPPGPHERKALEHERDTLLARGTLTQSEGLRLDQIIAKLWLPDGYGKDAR